MPALNLPALLLPVDGNQSRELIDLLIDEKIKVWITNHFGLSLGIARIFHPPEVKAFFDPASTTQVDKTEIDFFGENIHSLQQDVASSLQRYAPFIDYAMIQTKDPIKRHAGKDIFILSVDITIKVTPEIKEKYSLEKNIAQSGSAPLEEGKYKI